MDVLEMALRMASEPQDAGTCLLILYCRLCRDDRNMAKVENFVSKFVTVIVLSL